MFLRVLSEYLLQGQACNARTQWAKAEGSGVQTFLCHVVSSRPGWATKDPVPKTSKQSPPSLSTSVVGLHLAGLYRNCFVCPYMHGRTPAHTPSFIQLDHGTLHGSRPCVRSLRQAGKRVISAECQHCLRCAWRFPY